MLLIADIRQGISGHSIGRSVQSSGKVQMGSSSDHTNPRSSGGRSYRDIFIVMIDAGFRNNEASMLKWSDIDFDSGVIYLYRTKVSNEDSI